MLILLTFPDAFYLDKKDLIFILNKLKMLKRLRLEKCDATTITRDDVVSAMENGHQLSVLDVKWEHSFDPIHVIQ